MADREEMKQALLDTGAMEKELEIMNNRSSKSINGEDYIDDNDDDIEDTPHINLGEIPENVPLESFLGEDIQLVPNSTRKALIAKWNGKEHHLHEKDKKELETRNLLETWEATVKAIASDKKKQPMNNTPPLCYRFSWGTLRLIFLILLLYAELIVCQIFLLNVVIIGISIWFHLKTMAFSNGMIKNKMYSYRHREFKRFLLEEKSNYGSVELIPGKEGKWIEIKLEEDENDSRDIGISIPGDFPNLEYQAEDSKKQN
jgi:hypothetical protein